MKNWTAYLCCGLALSISLDAALGQDKPTSPPPKFDIKFIGAKTYSEKHVGGVAAESGNRARILYVYLRLPKHLAGFQWSNIDENVDIGVSTLQDSRGKHYFDTFPGSGGIIRKKNNVFEIYWIAPYIPVPTKEQRSLRYKSRIYLRDSSGKVVGSHWVDVPVKYHS